MTSRRPGTSFIAVADSGGSSSAITLDPPPGSLAHRHPVRFDILRMRLEELDTPTSLPLDLVSEKDEAPVHIT